MPRGPTGLTLQATSSGAGGTFNGVITGDPSSTADATYTVSSVALGMGSNTLTVTARNSRSASDQRNALIRGSKGRASNKVSGEA